MLPGLLTAFAAALCYGAGSVLQAVAARSTASAEGLDPRLLVRLVHSWRYVVGVGLDGAGFVLTLVAVRTLPLFVVQAVVASFLAVTAVLGAIFLRMPLTRRDKVALLVVLAGLVLVASSAAPDRAVSVTALEEWGVLVAVAALVLVALPLGRVPGARGAAALGAVAGLAFGATSVAARMLPADLSLEHLAHTVAALLRNPATYALVAAGALAMLTYAIALQRGTVTQATAPLVVGETVAPAVVGLLLLGDQSRPGWGVVAVVGFVLAVGGAVGLAQHGELTD